MTLKYLDIIKKMEEEIEKLKKMIISLLEENQKLKEKLKGSNELQKFRDIFNETLKKDKWFHTKPQDGGDTYPKHGILRLQVTLQDLAKTYLCQNEIGKEIMNILKPDIYRRVGRRHEQEEYTLTKIALVKQINMVSFILTNNGCTEIDKDLIS